MSEHAIDVPIGEDGTIRLQPAQLDALGAHPGDNVRILPVSRRPVRSRLGSHTREVEFTDADLAEVRAEMGRGIGEDLSR